MEKFVILLLIICNIALLIWLYSSRNKGITKEFIHSIECILMHDGNGKLMDRIKYAKDRCRAKKGVTSYGMHVVLDEIEKQLKKGQP